MKSIKQSLILALFLISTAVNSQAKKQSLVGTWRLVFSNGKTSNGSWKNDSSEIFQTKMITPSRFVFTIYDRKSDSLLMSAQGKISVSGNTYIETIEKSSMKDMIDKTYKYKSTITGNKWRIEGGGNDLELSEEWIRIE